MVEKVLLHVCCAPCSTHCIDELRNEGFEPILYFYNPNIHPEEEYRKRLEDIENYSKITSCELIIGDYDVEEWDDVVFGLEDEPEGGKRCEACFRMRLEKTAALKEDAPFTTSLTVSPYKDSKKILMILKEISEKNKKKFLEFNFKKKDGYKKSIALSKNHGLYRQDYCGCRYSIGKK